MPNTAPGTTWDEATPLGSALARFDEGVDAAFEPLRGHRAVDTTAAVVSNLADYGFVWSLLAGYKGRRRGPGRRRAGRALALAGFASLGVNTAMKALVRRPRPVAEGGGGVPGVRRPTSSSFPSGHTLAAFCTAVALAETPAETAAYLAFASAVAVSRVHLRAHHASDVVGGALIGAAVGAAGRRVLRRH